MKPNEYVTILDIYLIKLSHYIFSGFQMMVNKIVLRCIPYRSVLNPHNLPYF